jgi:hypothetical protein
MSIINTARPHGGFRVTKEGVTVPNAGPFDSPVVTNYVSGYYTTERDARLAAIEAGEAALKRVQANLATNRRWLKEHTLPQATTAHYSEGDKVCILGGTLAGKVGEVAGRVKQGDGFMFLVDLPGVSAGMWFHQNDLKAADTESTVKAQVRGGVYQVGESVRVPGASEPAQVAAIRTKKNITLYLVGGKWYTAGQLGVAA